MKSQQNKWDVLWKLFEEIINKPKENHEAFLSKANVSADIKKELALLLKAHYSQSSVLDKEPKWHNEFKQAFEPPKEIHGYKIEKKLGSGGMSDVYLGTKAEEGFTRKVAIKFATTGRYSKHILNSFNTELEVLLSLNHSNIERLYDGGVTKENVPFLIVEYIKGVHIDEYCENHKLDIKQRLRLFQKVCSAVDAVHRSLIIHRDIKAGNIMIAEDGEPKLLDFGLAKLSQEDSQKDNHTTLSTQMMTLAYASPEQINGKRINTASDIYSLGVLLYLLIAGKMPYKIKKGNLSETLKFITEKQVKLASKNTDSSSEIFKVEHKLSKKISGDLEQIIAKPLSKKPEDRYLSAAQFSDDIENFINNRPVIAKRDAIFYRIIKFIQRHKLSVSMSALAILSLIVLSINLYFQSSHLKKSLFELQQEQNRVTEVTNFLKNIFTISDPLITEKKIVNVKDLLDYSSQQLEQKFKDEKLTKATLFLTLGNVYMNMSDLTQADIMFSKAMQLYSEVENPKGILSVQMSQVHLLLKLGKIKQAELKIKPIYNNLNNYKDTILEADIAELYGQTLYKIGKLDLAKQIINESLLKRIESLGEKNEQVANSYLLLGNVYWRLGDFDKVKVNYQKAHIINQQLYGSENHKTLKSHSSLGVLAYAQGENYRALEHFDFVAKSRLEKLGNQHILTAEAYNRLGATYYETGLYDLAYKSLTKAKNIYIALELNKTLKYAKTLNNLGLVERQNQQYEKAELTFLESLKIETSILGAEHEDVAGIQNNLGMIAADIGEVDKALNLFKKAYDITYNKNQDKNVNVAFSMTNIGRMYMYKEDREQAKVWIDKALELRLEKLGINNLYYNETLSASAEIDISNNNLSLAKTKLKKVLEVRQNNLPANDWRINETIALSLLTLPNPHNAEKLKFACNLKQMIEKLGASHYRVEILKRKQLKHNFILSESFNKTNTSCDFLNQKQNTKLMKTRN